MFDNLIHIQMEGLRSSLQCQCAIVSAVQFYLLYLLTFECVYFCFWIRFRGRLIVPLYMSPLMMTLRIWKAIIVAGRDQYREMKTLLVVE